MDIVEKLHKLASEIATKPKAQSDDNLFEKVAQARISVILEALNKTK